MTTRSASSGLLRCARAPDRAPHDRRGGGSAQHLGERVPDDREQRGRRRPSAIDIYDQASACWGADRMHAAPGSRATSAPSLGARILIYNEFVNIIVNSFAIVPVESEITP